MLVLDTVNRVSLPIQIHHNNFAVIIEDFPLPSLMVLLLVVVFIASTEYSNMNTCDVIC